MGTDGACSLLFCAAKRSGAFLPNMLAGLRARVSRLGGFTRPPSGIFFPRAGARLFVITGEVVTSCSRSSKMMMMMIIILAIMIIMEAISILMKLMIQLNKFIIMMIIMIMVIMIIMEVIMILMTLLILMILVILVNSKLLGAGISDRPQGFTICYPCYKNRA
jgi:hypothetical protein